MINNYDPSISYQLGKANVVVDSLSRKSVGVASYMITFNKNLIWEVERLELKVICSGDVDTWLLLWMIIQKYLHKWIIESQNFDEYTRFIDKIYSERRVELHVDNHGALACGHRLLVPISISLRKKDITWGPLFWIHNSS